MQSGISASQELVSAFNTFVSSPTQRFLLANIANESLQPSTAIDSESSLSSSSWPSDLALLSSHLNSTTAAYVLLKTNPGAPDGYACVTYVPNAAPVRQKMLFASTRLTLVRELGVERFSETLFVTEADDISPAGWKRHQAHVKLEAPLTEEESANKMLRETEAQESGGTGARRSHYESGAGGGTGAGGGKLALRLGDSVLESLQGVREAGPGRLVQIKIDVTSETLLLDSAKDDISPARLGTTIAGFDPRYSFYTYPTNTGPATLFLYTCPTQSKIKERMMYASSRARIVGLAEGEARLQLTKKLEGSDPSEFTEQTLAAEFGVDKKEESKGFARPKRPGRK